MSEQYRTTSRANMRDEPSTKARIITTLADGVILHVDPDRTQDGEWLPVVLVRGWVHNSTVEAA